jgi:hypothetical protein
MILSSVMRLAVIAILLAATPAHADEWHAGLNLRAELGTHPVRAGGGYQRGDLDLSLVLDPMFWTDGQVDTDVLASWGKTWAVIGGFRTTWIGIEGGRQYQEKLVLGVGAPLPRIGDLPVRARWAFEATTLVVKHGGDLPTSWISFATGRDFIDLVNVGMWVSFEYARAL